MSLRATRVSVGPDIPSLVYEAAPRQPLGATFMDTFRSSLAIEITLDEPYDLVFDMVGIDTSIANALRRILLSEVPTVALERIYIYNNTSIVQDEVLSHRLGLIPLAVAPETMEMCAKGDSASEANTIVFKMEVTARASVPEGAIGMSLDSETGNTHVYASALEWTPHGSQLERYADSAPRPVYGDILVAKMKPGQLISLEAHAVKGIGRDHAKWSPVSTASYRLLPAIRLRQEVTGAHAEALAALCPMRVFDVEDGAAVVARPRDCTLCRECVREPEWAERVALERVCNHFIFSIESVGAVPSRALFRAAAAVLRGKCTTLIGELDAAAAAAGAR